MNQRITKLRNALKSGLATVAVVCALIGGFLLAISSGGGPGSLLVGLAHLGWWWAPCVWFGAAVVIFWWDWANDGVPNRPAVFCALSFPSFWVAMWSGRCGDRFYAAFSAANRGVGDWVHKAVSKHLVAHGALADGALALSILFVTIAVTVAWRYAKRPKGGIGSVGAGGASPVISRAGSR